MSEEEGFNFGCIVNCLKKDEGVPVIVQMINELVGTTPPAVSGEDITSGAPVKWKVDNKYYDAEVQFVVCSSENVSKELERADREYEALIMVCNLDERNVCDSLSQTWAQIESKDSGREAPAICLVIGTTKGVELSNHDDLLSWCVKHGCELIEWEREKLTAEQDQNDSESDDGYPPEEVGVARLAEALQAHAWSHMTMKRDPTLRARTEEAASNNSDTKQDKNLEVAATNQSSESSHVTGSVPGLKQLEEKVMTSSTTGKEETQRRVDSLLSTEDEQLIATGLQDGGDGDKDPGGESFENLFGRFAQMKVHAETLPHEERKAYAEQVVMAFWNAIGGDEEEIKSEQNE